MGFFKNLFSKAPAPAPNFVDGDVFYTILVGKYHLCKLLRHDIEHGIYHVLIYESMAQLPDIKDLGRRPISIYHSPIARDGFDNPQLLGRAPATDEEMQGYRAYILETGNEAEIVRLSKAYYKEGYSLTTIRQNEGAIAKYDLAIELIPNFFEAIDNRAFCCMNLGRWDDAIRGFRHSLEVNPDSVLAEFSIGECYMKMKNMPAAIAQFEKALSIDPDHQMSKDFLAKARG
jgi:tetratricopeptide (TPR) repeat protein